MVLQAFIDDSYKDEIYVLAGCIASEENWVKFSEEWEKMLPKWGTLNKNGKYHFKMSEMSLNPERLSRVPIFLTTIEKYISGFLSVKINTFELKRAKNRLFVQDHILDWSEWDEFFVTFRILMDNFHLHRKNMLDVFGDEKINFYFDEQTQKKRVFAMWKNYMNNRSKEARKFYGQVPRFEDDNIFLPLQAADLLAWWSRKMYADGTPEKVKSLDFGGFKPTRNKKLLRFSAFHDEEALVIELKKVIRSNLPGKSFYDIGKYPPWV